jgi:hypothetical protein
MSLEAPSYILITDGRITASGDNPEALLQSADPLVHADIEVKPWRLHTWVEGIPNSIFFNAHCKACKTTRHNKDMNFLSPCKKPEALDPTLTVLRPPHTHTEDRCCLEHEIHVSPHRNCIFR